MSGILIVDDNEDITHFLIKMLRQRFQDIEITGFTESPQAMEWLHSHTPELIITDLRMPIYGGAEIISEAMIKNPDVPIIVMSALPVLEDFRHTTQERDTIRFLSKPFMFEDLFNLLIEMKAKEPESIIHGFRPISFLQIVQLENKSCKINFSENEKSGILIFERGELFRAETSDLKGEEAVFEILTFKNPTIKLFDIPPSFESNIDKKLQVLLLEFCSRLDESAEAVGA